MLIRHPRFLFLHAKWWRLNPALSQVRMKIVWLRRLMLQSIELNNCREKIMPTSRGFA
jgi:hypothetical protein